MRYFLLNPSIPTFFPLVLVPMRFTSMSRPLRPLMMISLADAVVPVAITKTRSRPIACWRASSIGRYPSGYSTVSLIPIRYESVFPASVLSLLYTSFARVLPLCASPAIIVAITALERISPPLLYLRSITRSSMPSALNLSNTSMRSSSKSVWNPI